MIKFVAGPRHRILQSAQCNKQANIAHKVKISLLMIYVPRKGSLTQVGKTCSGSKQNMESTCLGKKNRKYLSLADSYSTATCSAMALWHITALLRCTCSRPACCVTLYTQQHCTISATHTARTRRTSVHLIHAWSVCCFLSGKNRLPSYSTQ